MSSSPSPTKKKHTVVITAETRSALIERSEQLITIAHRFEHQAASFQSEAAAARIMAKRIKRAVKEFDRNEGSVG